ncbi:response regulator [Salegentibacter sp. JZCK2]|uniref:PAS domain-containing hybrid sensor histidine kinase/response regulator n=1 Tax=Salegentibacter tibetensis TaxID=2873600 RepID=UPI001CCD285A|nr:PAS domain-containing hybrid sensor histidine kinase/response regulator [Salegentibacter tibetensis]MBZ9728714.1 response regulator [Salegentibacter tibetensis]
MDKDFLHNIPEESAENLYENSPCGYFSFLADGTIFRINKTLLNLLNYKEKEEVAKVKKIQDLLRIGGKIYFETHFFPLIKMQGFVKEMNVDLLRKDGSYFPALINVNQISSTQGNSTIYRASVLDITDRKKYEKVLLEGKRKAEEASKAKAEFLSTISHEIRTPLNAIVGIGNLIQKTSLDDVQKEYAKILQLSSDNLLELVNNLLDLSKLEADMVKLEERNFSLKELLEVLFHSFKMRARKKNIELKKDFPKDLPEHLLGDPVKLNQILTNLLGNALKFTKEGYIRLKIKELKSNDEAVELQFTVCDTGIGIPKDKLNIIFQEFSQASYDVNQEFGGTGLGLTISQKLLQMHGSQLHVSSEEGKGSEFSFALKFKFSTETSPKGRKTPRLKEFLANSGARVLVVDDNSVNLLIASKYLKGWGLAHETVASGEAAIQEVKESKYDIILMDLHMPKMDGYEASIEIWKICQEPPPVIIALSASGRGDVNLKMKRAGISAYVSKPFDPTDLQEVMVEYLNDRKSDPRTTKK